MWERVYNWWIYNSKQWPLALCLLAPRFGMECFKQGNAGSSEVCEILPTSPHVTGMSLSASSHFFPVITGRHPPRHPNLIAHIPKMSLKNRNKINDGVRVISSNFISYKWPPAHLHHYKYTNIYKFMLLTCYQIIMCLTN